MTKVNVGAIYSSNRHGSFKVIEGIIKGKVTVYRIEFIDTEYSTIVYRSNLLKGMVKDKLKPMIHGVGYPGLGKYPVTIPLYRKFMDLWKSMLQRCYDVNHISYASYGGKGVRVHGAWHNYTTFCEDIIATKGYDEVMLLRGTICLDKDKLQSKVETCNRVYSKDTCCFISREENRELADLSTKRVSFIVTYPSGRERRVTGISQFAEKLGLLSSGISACLTGKQKHCGGYKFRYVGEVA